MSLCQPKKNISCGACCGLLNLELKVDEYRNLLQERTQEFQEIVNFEIRHTIPEYRQKREKKELAIPRKDKTIYNCPFLGYIGDRVSRIGCMIHPAITGDPLSQNFSFYGTSICQAYDCKNKEKKHSLQWENLFQEIATDSIEYTKLSSNHIFTTRIEKFFISRGILIEDMFLYYRDYLENICYLILGAELRTTSFELEMES
jgi:hypothetical protein